MNRPAASLFQKVITFYFIYGYTSIAKHSLIPSVLLLLVPSGSGKGCSPVLGGNCFSLAILENLHVAHLERK